MAFIFLSFLAVIIVVVLWRMGNLRARFMEIAGALLIAGILGNLTSRLLHGYVIDFLLFDLHMPFADPWPTFNIADCCICAAGFLFVVGSLPDRAIVAE